MRVLLTGATGFVGRHVLPRLAGEHEVFALVRQAPRSPVEGVRVIVGDLLQEDLAAIVPRRLDVIVHLAQAYLDFPEHAREIFAVNAGGTQRLADIGRASGVQRFVLASSGSVYRPAYEPLRESDPPAPLSFHPATKLMAEQLLSYYGDAFNAVLLRLFAPYGPGQTDRLVPRLVATVREGRPVRLSRGGEPHLNPIHVADLVEVLAQAVDGAGGGVINVAGPRAVSVADLAAIIGSALGVAPILEREDREPAGDLVADTSAMRATFRLGRMIDPAVGIAALAAELVTRA